MSYLALDLDAKKKITKVARLAGMSPGDVLWGLAELWEWAWLEKSATASETVVTGCVGPNPALIGGLVEFGFLEADGDFYRIKGAEKYLNVAEGRSKGGKKASGNLKRGTKPGKSTPQTTSAPGLSPADPPAAPRLLPGLSPSTQHPTPNTLKAIAGEQPPAEYQTLVASLFDDFEVTRGSKYAPSGRDWKALERMRKHSGAEEIRTRWRRGLVGTFKRQVDTFADLDAKWNALATDEPRVRGSPLEPSHPPEHATGPVTVAEGSLF